MKIGRFVYFFEEYAGRIIVGLGAFFIFMAVLLMSRVYQWNFSICLLLGVALMIVGSALHFESFKWKVPSLRGLGIVLMYISPLFMAAAVVAMVFTVPEEAVMIPMYGGQDEHSSPFVYVIPDDAQGSSRLMAILLRRPYVWLAGPLMFLGVGMLASGFLLRLDQWR